MTERLLALIESSRDYIQLIKVSLFIGIILNADRVLLREYSPIRVVDNFDDVFPFFVIFAENILNYGFSYQFPQMLCGVGSFGLTPLPGFVLPLFILRPYDVYLLYSVLGVAIAFAGMFLLLHDEFKLNKQASFVGALFFSSTYLYLAAAVSLGGIPLLLWSFERIFDGGYTFKQRIIFYAYIIFYFMASFIHTMAYIMLPFYASYFLFISKIQKTAKNISLLLVIWSIFLIIYAPTLPELYFNATFAHRTVSNVWWDNSWTSAWEYFISLIFYISMVDGNVCVIPSLLGLPMVVYYLLISKADERDRYFYFPLLWILFITLYCYFIYFTPLWALVINKFGFLKGVMFDRFCVISKVPWSIVLAQATQVLITRKVVGDAHKANMKYWSIAIVFLYVVAGFVLHKIYFPTGLLWHWSLNIGSQFMLQAVSVLLLFVMIVINREVIKTKKCLPPQVVLYPMLLFAVLNTIYASSMTTRSNQLNRVSFYNFFHSDQIENIKKCENENIENFRVVGIGIGPHDEHAGTLIYNGFSTADAYFGLYPHAYREYWRKVIEPAYNKYEDVRSVFQRTSQHTFLYRAFWDDKLNFNLDLLKLIGVKYIFSSVKISHQEGCLEEVQVPDNEASLALETLASEGRTQLLRQNLAEAKVNVNDYLARGDTAQGELNMYIATYTPQALSQKNVAYNDMQLILEFEAKYGRKFTQNYPVIASNAAEQNSVNNYLNILRKYVTFTAAWEGIGAEGVPGVYVDPKWISDAKTAIQAIFRAYDSVVSQEKAVRTKLESLRTAQREWEIKANTLESEIARNIQTISQKDTGWKTLFRKGQFYVYRNKEFVEPVFLTGSVKLFGTKEELLEELGKHDFKYLVSNTLALEEDVAGLKQIAPRTDGATIVSYKNTPDRIQVRIRNQYPVILNVARNYNTNWHCWVDGKEVKVFRVYNSFMGVLIPENSDTVEIKYINGYQRSAWIITILGFIISNSIVILHIKRLSYRRDT